MKLLRRGIELGCFILYAADVTKKTHLHQGSLCEEALLHLSFFSFLLFLFLRFIWCFHLFRMVSLHSTPVSKDAPLGGQSIWLGRKLGEAHCSLAHPLRPPGCLCFLSSFCIGWVGWWREREGPVGYLLVPLLSEGYLFVLRFGASAGILRQEKSQSASGAPHFLISSLGRWVDV